MFTIGDFATMGRVSIRMLRHYDAIGLLRPARVDPASGYRYYEAGQLKRLNRLVALKDLGFTLAEVAKIVDADVGTAELRGMLRLRQAQVAQQIAADTARLARIEARLRMIEKEGAMSTKSVTVKTVPPVRIACLAGVAESGNHEDVAPVIGGLFGELFGALGQAQVTPAGPAMATYAPADGDRLTVTGACPIAADATAGPLEVTTLDGITAAACYVHHGPMAAIGEGYQALATWIEDNGHRTDGTAREVYLISHPEPEERWQTELQMPITQG
ncbi:MerR family transcriptional regulator [Spongiactinospora gelatinilytica]|uniref:MerR family transcriptional regulator n=1 Tax=Spongiactinospora gelatinilytica TaxID=2666298 RepID=A0A2W2EF96_9ACTN|nr:MerR family transcriptional regulator [Spongiactinospora gelatinilytica]PZG22892.1 MerR family transcriptional regulator [Spongiactinospora gelatinilytica]